MSLQATPEQLKTLTMVEHFNFKIIHALNSSPRIRRFLTRLGAIYGKWYVGCCTSNIVLDHGFENFKKANPDKAILLVANHRSFFDQFVISGRLFRLYGPHHNIYFPVRSNFFYDNLLGLLINLKIAVGFMYPPIVRDKKRLKWNNFATDLMVDILQNPANMIGFHPEGTRNQGSNPYSLLPGKPGCGELIYRARPNVIPVFLQGFPETIWQLTRNNLSNFKEKKPIVHMVMGQPMDLSEMLKQPLGRKTYLLISKMVMEGINDLAKKEQEIRARYAENSSSVVATKS